MADLFPMAWKYDSLSRTYHATLGKNPLDSKDATNLGPFVVTPISETSGRSWECTFDGVLIGYGITSITEAMDVCEGMARRLLYGWRT